MYATPEGMLDIGQGRSMYQNRYLQKFYEQKKHLLDDFIKEEKKAKYEMKAQELRLKLEKQQIKE